MNLESNSPISSIFFQENVGLKSFNLAMAGLGQEGSEAMAKALKENRTLVELDISMNRINVEGAQALGRGVKENDTLKVLKVKCSIRQRGFCLYVLMGFMAHRQSTSYIAPMFNCFGWFSGPPTQCGSYSAEYISESVHYLENNSHQNNLV